MSMPIKTRFAPSPTGYLHLGNVRTALFAALLAGHHQGIFLLRIEDTDQERSEECYIHQLIHDLQRLGVFWQEGPGHDLGNGPYLQSERQNIYADYYNQLEKQGHAYPCFCTEHQLALSRKAQLSAGLAPKYSGLCKGLSQSEIEEKRLQGIPATLRFSVPKGQLIEFTDLIKGVQRFNSDDLGDFIIRRASGMPSFMFCNAVDDSMMGVTHVIRGEDHLTNTPRQLLILEALGLRAPTYGHNALIVGPSGAPLSKREGSRNLCDLEKEGYFPEAIVNCLARLGHRYEDEGLLDLDALAEGFSLDKLSKSAAKFDPHQLQHWQKEAVMQLPESRLHEWFPKDAHSLIPTQKKEAFTELVRENALFPADVTHWAHVYFDPLETYSEEVEDTLLLAGAEFFQYAKMAFTEKGADFKAAAEQVKTTSGLNGKQLFKPIRAAITGEHHGPDMSQIVALLGQEETLRRLENAVTYCRQKTIAT